MQGEFRMITDLATVTPKELLFNYDELKAFLTEALQEYNTLIVTEDAISDAKAKRATLNKLADNINSYRINVKKQLMAQYDADFKPKCDELVSMTKDASDNIAKQIKAFEDAEKAEKLEKLHSEYIAMTNDETELYCPWECVVNDKWANKTYPYENAVAEIKDALERAVNDLAAIRDLGGDDTPYLLDVYKQTHGLSAVVRKASELKTMRANEEARKREAAERAAREAAAMEQAAKAAHAPVVEADAEAPQTVTVDFRVTCTRTQLKDLGEYMKLRGIHYGRIGE